MTVPDGFEFVGVFIKHELIGTYFIYEDHLESIYKYTGAGGVKIPGFRDPLKTGDYVSICKLLPLARVIAADKYSAYSKDFMSLFDAVASVVTSCNLSISQATGYIYQHDNSGNTGMAGAASALASLVNIEHKEVSV
jgi:hypothetical protein